MSFNKITLLSIVLALATSAGVACGSPDGESAFTPSDEAGSGNDGSFGNDGDPFAMDGSGGGGDGGGGDGGGGGDSGNTCKPPTSLTVLPAGVTATVTPAGSFTQAYTVTANYASAPSVDVTAGSFFFLSNPAVGSFTGSTFTWGGVFGGTITIGAQNCGVVGTTTLNLKLSVSLGTGLPDGGGGGGGIADAGGAAGQFSSATASGIPSCNPSIVYPADGVLIPPNTNVMEVHFLPGAPANNLFEISFENAVTDVRIYTNCSGSTAAQGLKMNGGCVFELDQAEWNYIAQTNRDGDPITVKVRGIGCDPDPMKAGASATEQISFAKQDVQGTLYYWASILAAPDAGVAFNSGGVFRYDFGVRGQLPDPVLTPNTGVNPNHLCIGCHDVSRDGRKMAFAYDDNDDDDEYNDVRTDIYDIASGTAAKPIIKSSPNVFEPGYHTWNRAHSQLLLSDGQHNTSPPNGAFTRVSDTASVLGYTQPALPDGGLLRGTNPDWASDDGLVVFAAPPNQAALPPNGAGFWPTNGQPNKDLWFAGASIYVSTWNAGTNMLGGAQLVVPSTAGSNYYYPSYSPDGSFIAFNYAPTGPNFHNPQARVQLVVAGAASPTPDDLAALNGSPAGAPVATTNSWPRWSPFVQSYKSGNILWMTMSSTRSYGLRIVNDASKQNCYPRESPIGPVFSATPNCTRTQLWMAAVRLDKAGVAAGTDVSYPAFWLPFQDPQTNNHLGQWAQKSFSGTCALPDGGSPLPDGGTPGTCAPGFCCDLGGCAPCAPPPPPNPTCAATSNCSPGNCCVAGTCAACSDAGSVPPAACNTCLDCSGQACVGGSCGSCTNSSQCCAPLQCNTATGKCFEVPR